MLDAAISTCRNRFTERRAARRQSCRRRCAASMARGADRCTATRRLRQSTASLKSRYFCVPFTQKAAAEVRQDCRPAGRLHAAVERTKRILHLNPRRVDAGGGLQRHMRCCRQDVLIAALKHLQKRSRDMLCGIEVLLKSRATHACPLAIVNLDKSQTACCARRPDLACRQVTERMLKRIP